MPQRTQDAYEQNARRIQGLFLGAMAARDLDRHAARVPPGGGLVRLENAPPLHDALALGYEPPFVFPPQMENEPGIVAPLNVANLPGLVVAALFLTQLRLPPDAVDGPGRPPGNRAHVPTMGVDASPPQTYAPLPSDTSAAVFQHIANSALPVCVLQRRSCAPALVVGAVAGAGAALGGLGGFLLGLSSTPDCQPQPMQRDAPDLGDLVMHTLSDDDRERVWRAVLNCGGDHDCTVSELRAVLEKLTPDQQQRLLALSPQSDADRAPAPVGWPRGAHALVAPVDWLDHLADVLALQISPEAAAFELDIAAIVGATRVATHARHSSDVSPGEAVNQARLSAIAERFTQAGLHVQPRPFELAAHTVFGFPYTSRGQNLLVELNGEGPAQRTLMLVAHGDVAGADAGSTGALDNATGVAALLAVARQLNARGLPPGVRVQFLITDQEELGLHGAKAYVDQCRAAENAADPAGHCPDVAVNVDLLGYGDELTLSGSDQHDRYRDGDSGPRDEPVAMVSAEERRMTQLLRDAAAAVGLRVHEAADWTLQSDHIALQRRGVPTVGLSLMNRNDFAAERDIQRLRQAYLDADDAVDWSLYQAYVDGRLDPAEVVDMEQRMADADAATAAYQASPLSGRQRVVHTGADLPERIDTQRAMAAVHALQGAVAAWVAEPPPARVRDR